MASTLVAKNFLTRSLQRRLPLASTGALANPFASFLSPNTCSTPSSLSSSSYSSASSSSSFGGYDRSLKQRYFSTSNGGGDNDKEKQELAGSSTLSSSLPPALDYNVEEIIKTFTDTSYYDPVERPDYSHMTNEQLKDSASIPGWELIHSPPQDKETIPRGALVGTVVSTKMQKTVNVAVDRYRVHPKYHKRLRYTKKFMAHDELQVASTGDLVMIVPCQRISRHKHFMLREIIRAKGQL